ncbi:MAG: hypothetical protein ABIS35_08800 [Terracoccus sp.]
MTVSPVLTPGPVRRSWRVADRLRWGLSGAALLLAVLLPLVGTQPGSLADLRAAIGHGSVSEVTVTGVLREGSVGYGTAHVVWVENGRTHATDVLQVSDGEVSTQDAVGTDDRVVGDVRDHIAALPGAGSVRMTSDERPRESHGSFFGWEVPVWFGSAVFAVWLLTVALLSTVDEPRRATRWAWLWVLLSPFAVVGVPAFLVLGYASPSSPSPARGRRLTGGWAFVLLSVLSGIVSTNS